MGSVFEYAGVGAGPVPLQRVALVDVGIHPGLSALAVGSDCPKQPDNGTVSNRTVSISACRMNHRTGGCIINMMSRHNP